MRASALTESASADVRVETLPPSWHQLALAWAASCGATLALAAVTAVLASSWLDGPTRELPNRASLVVDIFANNLLIALLPLIGGWLAAGHRRAGRRALAGLHVVVPAAVVARSLFVIGAVGGSDAGWLLNAARWWPFELAALGTASCTGLWLVRHPDLRECHGPSAIRRALVVVVGTLAVGSVMEVFTA